MDSRKFCEIIEIHIIQNSLFSSKIGHIKNLETEIFEGKSLTKILKKIRENGK